ncbi:MAG TPA: pyridoxal-phosphate dependent enzyme [Candidatus Limnocylindrales bacterium]|nr:pyridoxal-phosphate dependent enzyme [Candidatus Limnocylindrales bacterium]
MTWPGAATPVPPATSPTPGRLASRLVCAGCGAEVPAHRPFVVRCPAATPGDDIDHVLARRLAHAALERRPEADGDPNPYVRYRARLHAYHVAMAAGWDDARFVSLVRALDEAVAEVDGHGFRTTPLARSASLDAGLGFHDGAGVWVKDETGNVSGSHKARHLMGVMLALRVAEALDQADPAAPLAIASCGNAALAAAVVARAARRRLLVFVPPSAEAAIVERLRGLQAEIEVCERQPRQAGDPTYLRLLAAIEAGAVPFTVQGNLDGLAIEGGATLGWELVDQLAERGSSLDRLVIQVGGGAFASAQALAFEDALALGLIDRLPRIDAVQTQGGYPLSRAHQRVLEHLGVDAGVPLDPDRIETGLREVARHRSAYMWPWETEPVSIAHGILDDETYDWLAIVRAMLLTGGRCVVVDEATLQEANALGRPALGIDADHTGTAGLAGLMSLARDGLVDAGETVAVIFSGVRRSSAARHRTSQGGKETP